MKRARNLSLKECYAILGLAKGATLDDVKRAYRRRAFELHPDLNPGDAAAGRRFQQLNEAYVALSRVLQDVSRPGKEQEKNGASDSASADGASASASAEENTSAGHAQSAAGSGTPPPGGAADAEKESQRNATGGDADDKTRRTAQAAYGQEDVLRDLLNDPFARRVFEDIYREASKQSESTTAPPPPPNDAPPPEAPKPSPPPVRKVQMEWGKRKLNLDFTHGVKGVVKGWLRQQIDETQSFKLPAYSLVPGARIRLQIRRGLSEELNSIEITLPQDFVIGKPVRLRGLGKKVGPWQGDLYLTLEAK